MELIKLFNLQGSLFIMILAGAVLKRKGIIDEPGKRCLTDLCVNIIIPCNIVKSCLIEFDISIMKACGLLYDCVKWRFSGQSCGGGGLWGTGTSVCIHISHSDACGYVVGRNIVFHIGRHR